MAGRVWSFLVYDILTRRFLADVPLYDVGYNDPLDRTGTFEGKLTVSKMPVESRRQMRAALESRNAWVFAYTPGGRIDWHGQILAAPWSRTTSTVTVKAEQTSGWLKTRYLSTRKGESYKWAQKDQLQIAREIVQAATKPGGGRLRIAVDATVSGVLRDLTIPEQAFQEVAAAIDSMATRDRGFDWAILARDSSVDGAPELYLQTWYPERRSVGAPVLALSQVERDGRGWGNVLTELDWPNDWGAARNWVWATGDGEAPGMMTAHDADPQVTAGRTVLRESVISYSGSGITKAATLASHAYAERRALSHTVSTLSVPVGMDDPPFEQYQTGDRFRLTYQDDWMDVDLPAVRCIDRTVRVAQRGARDSVTLELDLADTYRVGAA